MRMKAELHVLDKPVRPVVSIVLTAQTAEDINWAVKNDLVIKAEYWLVCSYNFLSKGSWSWCREIFGVWHSNTFWLPMSFIQIFIQISCKFEKGIWIGSSSYCSSKVTFISVRRELCVKSEREGLRASLSRHRSRFIPVFWRIWYIERWLGL